MALSTLPDESRVARPLASAGKTGSSASQSAGSSRFCMRAISSASSGYFRSIGSKLAQPRLVQALAALTHAVVEMLAHAVRHEEFGVFGPTVTALGQADFLFAQRLAVGRAGVLLVRRAVADMAVDDDQRRRVRWSGGKSRSPAPSSRRSLTSPTRCTFQP